MKDYLMTTALPLAGKHGLIVGIANENSIAYGCAKHLRAAGAELAATYLNAKAERHVRPLAEALDVAPSLFLPLDVSVPGQMEAVFDTLGASNRRLDFVIHSIAFAPRDDLHGRVVDVSETGFAQAMQVSCWSFLRMAKLAEPLFSSTGGAIITMTYYGADKVVPNYNVMGPVKAALESSVRYVAAELAPSNIRVFAVSPGPIRTRAAGGIAHFDDLIDDTAKRSPGHRLVDIDQVGQVATFLVGDGAAGMTGDTIYVDAGVHNVA